MKRLKTPQFTKQHDRRKTELALAILHILKHKDGDINGSLYPVTVEST